MSSTTYATIASATDANDEVTSKFTPHFPKIQAFLDPLKDLHPYVDDCDGRIFRFIDTFQYALSVLYSNEFDDPSEHDDPQEFADLFFSDVMFTSYEEDPKGYVEALRNSLEQLCIDNGLRAMTHEYCILSNPKIV